MPSSDSHQFRASRLWKLVSRDDQFTAALAFWSEGDATTQGQAVDAIARHLKFRHKSVMALPDDRKARHLASLPVVPDLVASRLLIVYHLKTKRPMMAAFLDAIGIAHDHGLISEELLAPPDAARCQQAARDLATAFPRDDVTLYFATLVSQDEDLWAALKGLAGS